MKITKLKFSILPILLLSACGSSRSMKVIKKNEIYEGKSVTQCTMTSYSQFDYFSNGFVKEERVYTKNKDNEYLSKKVVYLVSSNAKKDMNITLYDESKETSFTHQVEEYDNHQNMTSFLVEVRDSSNAFTVTQHKKLTYHYNVANKITEKITEDVLAGTLNKEEYTYDELNRNTLFVSSNKASTAGSYIPGSKIAYIYFLDTPQIERKESYDWQNDTWEKTQEIRQSFNENKLPITNEEYDASNRKISYYNFSYPSAKRMEYEHFGILPPSLFDFKKIDEGYKEYASTYTGIEDPIKDETRTFMSDGSGVYNSRYVNILVFDKDNDLIERTRQMDDYFGDYWSPSSYFSIKNTYEKISVI